MTLYTGENIAITHTATLDGTALTSADVASVTIEIFDSAGDTVVSEAAMTWNATLLRWEYDWDTGAGATPTISDGTHRAKIEITGLDGSLNWEYKRIRLSANPV